MNYADWHYKSIRDFTLEDALQAYEEGFYSICMNGVIGILTNDPDYSIKRLHKVNS
ncbi:MAG: hypothetical protein N2317_08615 [Syntrophales bacterium]|nr:hypothetical protein [Syntrophales bacterium]